METVQDRVKRVIKKLTIVEEISEANQDLLQLGFDSLKKVELIVELEDEFNIRFNDSELNPNNLKNVKSLIILVKKHLGEED